LDSIDDTNVGESAGDYIIGVSGENWLVYRVTGPSVRDGT